MTHLLKSLLNGNLLALVAFTAVLTPQALKAADADGQCPQQNATLLGPICPPERVLLWASAPLPRLEPSPTTEREQR